MEAACALLLTPENDVEGAFVDPGVLDGGQRLRDEVCEALRAELVVAGEHWCKVLADKVMVAAEGAVWHAGLKTLDAVLKEASKTLAVAENRDLKAVLKSYKSVGC